MVVQYTAVYKYMFEHIIMIISFVKKISSHTRMRPHVIYEPSKLNNCYQETTFTHLKEMETLPPVI